MAKPESAQSAAVPRNTHRRVPARGRTGRFSRAALALAVGLFAATFLLSSPPRDETYPGAIPWRQFSPLHGVVELLALGRLVPTARGTEIKELAFHLAGVFALLLLAVRLIRADRLPDLRRRMAEPWLAAQALLLGWVAVSGLSMVWSTDPPITFGQSALYALAVAWAVALGWTLRRDDLPRLLGGLLAVSAAAAALCAWYHFERLPAHRPGYPLGNPNTLGAALVPGLLISACLLLAIFDRRRRGEKLSSRDLGMGVVVIAAAAALVVCFRLTSSRAAFLGLLAGLGVVLVTRVGPRLRWTMGGLAIVGVIAAGALLLTHSRVDTAMARSATVRFRFYAWRYAAELWGADWSTRLGGHGAGAYPRLAGQRAVHDRQLDPAAFMGDMVEHAHNELFEILTEIGLVGGVTFVAGVLATLIAAGLLVRAEGNPLRRWPLVAVFAALVALVVDSLFSSNLRLAGVPAIFFTLVGATWAAARAAQEPSLEAAVGQHRPPGAAPRLARPLALTVALVASFAAGSLTVWNWSGVRHEEAGQFAARSGDSRAALQNFALAERRLLDPVRRLIANARGIYASLPLAQQAAEEYLGQLGNLAPSTAPSADAGPSAATVSAEPGTPAEEGNFASGTTSGPQTRSATGPGTGAAATQPLTPALELLRGRALELSKQTLDAAADMRLRAPAILNIAGMEARAAELIAAILLPTHAEAADEWYARAGQLWRLQRTWRPYDLDTLLALTRHPATLEDHVIWLRDALRAPALTEWTDLGGLLQAVARWQEALRRIAVQPAFARVLDDFLAVVGPISVETDLDSLVLSGAPEVRRLAAHYAALQGNFASAQQHAAQAARLYTAVRRRFPTLHAIALLEQADFALRESPAQADTAAALLRTGLAELPQVSEQKAEALAEPFRRALVLAHLAAGREPDAEEVMRASSGGAIARNEALADAYIELVRLYVRRPAADRPDLQPWLSAALRRVPAHAQAWAWRAWLAAERGEAAAVRQVFDEAAAAGVKPDEMQRIRRSLCEEFPALCDELSE